MAQKRKTVDAQLDDVSPAPKRPASNISLAYPSLSRSPSGPLQQPTQLLTFSYTPDHVLEFNDSALRYYIDPPREADLGYGYDKWIRRPDERGRLDALLRACSRFKKGLREGPDVHVMCWRGIMTKILSAPYEERWELNDMRVGGTLYFEEHLSDARLKEKNAMEPRHRLQSYYYYGYAFESYCTTSTPGRRGNTSSHVQGWGGDVNTNIQWCSVVKTKLGNHRTVIGGEVDCVRGQYSGNTTNFVDCARPLELLSTISVNSFKFRREVATDGVGSSNSTVVLADRPSPFVGRARLLTRAVLTALETLFAEDSDLFLDEACTWLGVEHGITISPSALGCWAHPKDTPKAGRRAKRATMGRIQTDFVGDTSEFIAIDETSKNEQTYARNYGHAPGGQRAHIIDVFARGDCVLLWPWNDIAARAIGTGRDLEGPLWIRCIVLLDT